MPENFSVQVAELAVRIAGAVSAQIQERAMNMDRSQRRKIEEMLEKNLADIVVNSIEKTASFRSQSGLEYAQKNFDHIVKMYVDQLTGKI